MSTPASTLDQPAPLAQWPGQARQGMAGVFADIDDTLTTDGRVHAAVFDAMERLRGAGLLVVPITGRPAGWCDMIARTWPVDGVVGENGAMYFHYDTAARRMRRAYAVDAERRRENTQRLAQIRDEILRDVPGVALSADQPYREADLAIDFCEDVQRVPDSAIDAVVAIFEAHGATAKVSSIHVNGWFGDYDKLTTSLTMMRELFGIDLAVDKAAYVFSGDSPNDAPMFGYFPNAVGVANVVDFADLLEHRPRWVTSGRSGAGFVELAKALLAARA